MYSGTIILFMNKNSSAMVTEARYINQDNDYILVYSHNHVWLEDKVKDHPFTDEKGNYRKYSSGGINSSKEINDRFIRIYGDRVVYKADGNIKFVKFYESDDEGKKQYISNNWSYKQIKQEYPTQKPYKLLERVICLGTK